MTLTVPVPVSGGEPKIYKKKKRLEFCYEFMKTEFKKVELRRS